MLIHKAFKFKLKITPHVERKCLSMAGCCRLIWNKALAMNLYRLENRQPILWYHEMTYWLTFWKSSEDMAFLKDSHSQALQQSLKNLDRAFKDAFDKKQSNKRIPIFKRKGGRDSFRYPQGFKLEGNRVYLPKIGWVSYFNSRLIVGKPRNLTVCREADGWYISVQTEQEVQEPQHLSKTLVGVDRGISKLAYLSDGTGYDAINSFRMFETKLAKEQRKFKRKTKYSANWKKQQKKIAAIHSKIANCRKDRLHWISNQISKNHAVIVLEDLKVANMSKSARGTVEEPGANVKAKSGLNKSILDQGWSMFATMLDYKQRWRGGETLYVPAHYTSQTCPECGHVAKENRKSQASFACISCGYENNADHVGALNILARGHRVLACGEPVLTSSLKQEPIAA